MYQRLDFPNKTRRNINFTHRDKKDIREGERTEKAEVIDQLKIKC